MLVLLPKTVTHLKLRFKPAVISDTITESVQFDLPPCLKKAEFSHWYLSWLAKLPNGLDKLAIHWVLLGDSAASPLADFTPTLPITLRKLTLYFLNHDSEDDSDYGSDTVPSVPGHPFSTLTSLRSLKCSGLQFNSSMMRHLSRKLRKLVVQFDEFLPEDCAFLPPYLRTFDISPHDVIGRPLSQSSLTLFPIRLCGTDRAKLQQYRTLESRLLRLDLACILILEFFQIEMSFQ